MASLNRSPWSVCVACVLTWSLSGCGGAGGSTPVVDADGPAELSVDEEMASGLPTVAIPGPKPAANKTTKTGAAATPTPATKGAATKTAATQPAAKTAPPADKAAENNPFEYWAGRCTILQSDVYVQRNDLFGARAALNSIVDGVKNFPELVAEAKQKLASLEGKEKLKSRITTDKGTTSNLLDLDRGN